MIRLRLKRPSVPCRLDAGLTRSETTTSGACGMRCTARRAAVAVAADCGAAVAAHGISPAAVLISNAASTRRRTKPDSELVKLLRPLSPKRGMYSFDVPVGGVRRCSCQRHLMGEGSEPLT